MNMPSNPPLAAGAPLHVRDAAGAVPASYASEGRLYPYELLRACVGAALHTAGCQ